MLKYLRGGFFAALALAGGYLLSIHGPAIAQNVVNYMDQGGAAWHVGGTLGIESGGVQTVKSGGVLNIASGGKIEVNGADVTASVSGVAVAGVASGYVVARGETALGGSNPTAVTTGLTNIAACSLTIKLGSAPGVGTSVVTYGTSGGTLNMYGWKVTNSSTTTLIASTGTETVGWVCLGN
jgi:hypothetical protein